MTKVIGRIPYDLIASRLVAALCKGAYALSHHIVDLKRNVCDLRDIVNDIRDRVKEALSRVIDSHKYVINVDVDLEVLDEVKPLP